MFLGDTLSLFISLVLFLWYFLAVNKATQAMVTDCYVDRPQSLSSHAFCGSVSQSSASQKKTLHHGAHTLVRSPLIPLLRPQQQLRRLETRIDSRSTALRLARIDQVQTGVGF